MTLEDFILYLKHAILAGVCISFGGTAYLKSSAVLPEIGGFIGALLFAFGLIVVIHNKHVLYTGTAGFVTKETWGIVPISIIGKLVGCVIMGMMVRYVQPSLTEVADGIINTRLTNGLLKNCLLAILCGFIMTEAVYHSKFNGERYLPLIFGVPLFIVCGFTHSIADIFYYAMGSTELLLENVSQIFCIWVSTLVGNFIGCNVSNKREYFTYDSY
jgi:formate/nitrite transporter FocA (FNT family)